MHVLIHIPHSPWSHRTCQALDAQGVVWRGEPYVQGLSEPALRWRLRRPVGRVTVPVLFADDGPPVEDSLAIAAWASARSERPLVPAGALDPVRHWVDLAEQGLGAGRVRTTLRVLASPEALDDSLPPPLRAMGAAGRGIGRVAAKQLLAKYPVAARTEAEAEAQLAVTLQAIREGLADGPWLLDAFSFADLAAASVLGFVAPATQAPLGPAARLCWTSDTLAHRFWDLVAWRDRVAAEVSSRRSDR